MISPYIAEFVGTTILLLLGSGIVAKKMADVLGKDDKWIDAELKKFNKLIKNYIV